MQESRSTLVTPVIVAAPRAAHRLLSLICVLMVITTVVGRLWDGWWHITYTFDGFWVPPHVFVYAMSALSGLLVMLIAYIPSLRHAFGPGFPALGLPFDLPGPLFLMASGFVALGIAGVVVDNLWHSLFGLNETGWSAPHAAIGGSLAAIGAGYVSARLHLRGARPLRWYTHVWVMLLLIGFSFTWVGPLYDNATLDPVRAIGAIPVLAAQSAARQANQLLIDWNLTRTNPVAIPLNALAAGCALVLVHALQPRRWLFCGLMLFWTLLTYQGKLDDMRWLDHYAPTLHNAVNWLPLPLLPAALIVVVAERFGARSRTSWLLAGLGFGLCMFVLWGTSWASLVAVLLAAPMMALGACIGRQVFRMLEQPSELRAWGLLVALVIALPLATGLVDLALRFW